MARTVEYDTHTWSPTLQPSQSHRLLVAHAGAMVTPSPRPREHATMKRSRREMSVEARILIPDTATLANRNVVMPPSTHSGIDVKNAAICRVEYGQTRVSLFTCGG